ATPRTAMRSNSWCTACATSLGASGAPAPGSNTSRTPAMPSASRASRADFDFCSGPVRAGQVLGAAHFDQARGGALEGAGQALATVQVDGLGVGGADQVDVAVVELVDEGDEAARGIV